MNEKERFIYEMMDTPTLAQHAQKCVLRMHTARQSIRQAQMIGDKKQEGELRNDMNRDKNLHRELVRVIKSRQLKLL